MTEDKDPGLSQRVLMYSSQFCGYCIRAKMLLNQKGVSYDEIKVDFQPQLRQEMMLKSKQRTVPQIWIGETHVGGCDDLFLLEQQGQLDSMLKQ